MRRGSTPIHEFGVSDIGVDVSAIKYVKITYSQDGVTLVERKVMGNEIEDYVVKIQLTQAETLSFEAKMTASIQLRVLTNNMEVIPSDIIPIEIEDCLDDEVLE